jgi:hypothetical protein
MPDDYTMAVAGFLAGKTTIGAEHRLRQLAGQQITCERRGADASFHPSGLKGTRRGIRVFSGHDPIA